MRKLSSEVGNEELNPQPLRTLPGPVYYRIITAFANKIFRRVPSGMSHILMENVL